MRRTAFLDVLSRRAPAIVSLTLCVALLADWVGAPIWLPKSLAIVVGSLAILLFAARRRRQLNAQERSEGDRTWLAYELAGHGMPPGFYPLSFFAVVAIMLIGIESAYSTPAWAAFALGVAWGFANAHYPIHEEGDERS